MGLKCLRETPFAPLLGGIRVEFFRLRCCSCLLTGRSGSLRLAQAAISDLSRVML